MAYAFVSAIYGEHLAESITNFIEYIPITNSSYDPFAALYNLTTPSAAAIYDSPLRRQITSTSQWGIVIFPGFVGLDMVGAGAYIEYVSLQAAFPGNISLIAHTLDDVPTASLALNGGQHLVPTHTFSNPPSGLDVLVIPGMTSAGPFPYHDEIVRFIQRTYPTLKHVLSVGTGSMLLAAAGLLDGRQATTSKALFRPATAPFLHGHNITWTAGRWVRDGNVWTTSGTASSLDAVNALSIDLYGEVATTKAAIMMEYTPRTNASDDPFASVWGVRPQT
ncbi:class I glutamine amidotransferase-like protein [Clavulina sp. PMI_390]|nr:class I glutamine amidotransferase-like protein [Clavulina sp. PMI_390]